MTTNNNQNLKEATELFLFRNQQVLLGLKKTGLGKDKRLGIGGKCEPGESILETAVREVEEEICITLSPDSLDKIAIIDFIFPYKPAWSMKVHFFFVTSWSGEPQETIEISPEFYPVTQVPYEKMWQDTKLWFPDALNGKRLTGKIVYGEDNEQVVDYHFTEWENS